MVLQHDVMYVCHQRMMFSIGVEFDFTCNKTSVKNPINCTYKISVTINIF